MSKVMATYLVFTASYMHTQLLYHFLYVPLSCKYVPLPVVYEVVVNGSPGVMRVGMLYGIPVSGALPHHSWEEWVKNLTADCELWWHLQV